MRVFFRLVPALHLGKFPTDCLQVTGKKKPHYQFDIGVSNAYTANLAPQPGLEPGTYGLTVRRSTN